ncbi:MAG: hypothetical protein GYA23_12130 [Methanomicrobiales archaeon]|nr:hypothetical protein [Methanomicrobiales archaeon]
MRLNAVEPGTIRSAAEEYVQSGQLYCPEAIVKAINDGFKAGYPNRIIGLASGFSYGIGGAGCSCAAVTGGVMAIGMIFGRKEPGDPEVDRCLGLCRELHTIFSGRHGFVCCRTLIHGMALNSIPQKEQCIDFTGEVAEEAAKIILRELNRERSQE